MTHSRLLLFAMVAMSATSAALADVAVAARQAPASPPTTYRETIPGTLVTFEMVAVPGGEGVRPFFLGRTEVTWEMYDAFTLARDEKPAPAGADAVARPSKPYGAPDYGWGHAGYPAISIAREAADAFAVWLTKKTGKAYRVPTEAEWAHAAALAVKGGGAEGLDAIAWHRGNAVSRTRPVASARADALGLFDLFGNAAEWVDAGEGARVTRGGSFRDPLASLGPAMREEQDDSWNERDPQLPKSKWWLSDGPFVGFRLARSR